MTGTNSYLDYNDSENAVAGYHNRNVALEAFIAQAVRNGTTMQLNFKPAEQPNGYIITKQHIEELLSKGGDSLVLMFAVTDVPLAGGGIRKDLTMIAKPFDTSIPASLPFSKIVEMVNDGGVPRENLVSSNTIILGTRCCPPSSNLSPGRFSECVGKLLQAEALT